MSAFATVAPSLHNTMIIAGLRGRLNHNGQTIQIVDHMIMRGSISQLEADSLYRVKRLASRINDLKRYGLDIHVEIKRDLTGKKYARYSLN